jgi:hypothetical protein
LWAKAACLEATAAKETKKAAKAAKATKVQCSGCLNEFQEGRGFSYHLTKCGSLWAKAALDAKKVAEAKKRKAAKETKKAPKAAKNGESRGRTVNQNKAQMEEYRNKHGMNHTDIYNSNDRRLQVIHFGKQTPPEDSTYVIPNGAMSTHTGLGLGLAQVPCDLEFLKVEATKLKASAAYYPQTSPSTTSYQGIRENRRFAKEYPNMERLFDEGSGDYFNETHRITSIGAKLNTYDGRTYCRDHSDACQESTSKKLILRNLARCCAGILAFQTNRNDGEWYGLVIHKNVVTKMYANAMSNRHKYLHFVLSEDGKSLQPKTVGQMQATAVWDTGVVSI